jgi:cobalt-precorrin 5A hydrolase / cobalt-factor III methyltransferase / precorrin-3B C17-methyltransferase
MRPETIVVFLTTSAEPVARSAAQTLGARLHGRSGEGLDAEFTEVAEHLRSLFAAGHPIVGVCASGILIRSLAPLIGDKNSEPPVVALAEDGSAAIPLLGGHRGANDLARSLASALGAHASLTTAGEVTLGLALDAPPAGWRLENPEDAKVVMAALLSGAGARLSGSADWLAPLADRAEVVASSADAPVVLSVKGCEPLIYRRQVYALGVGCSRNCPPDELIALVHATLADNGISRYEIASICSVAQKSDEAAVHALAANIGVAAGFYAAETLEALTPRLANPSAVVFSEIGCHGVAEAAALAGAGIEADLAVEKQKSANATCAIARISGESVPALRRGRLSVVGIGPGAADLRTPEASRLIAEADEIVGYSLYLDLLGPLAKGKERHDFPLGGEEDRCRFALERAGEGRNVALVCSGDAGIYAMGALVMELLDRPQSEGGVSEAARRVEVINAPGVSALQLASARAGALIGHDFCAISLSDLLTPRGQIIDRVKAAAEGDFVIAFYNPVSKRRRTLLAEAREILLRLRPADTPVLLASNLGRSEEQLTLRTLETLDIEEVDMLTVVLVGSSTSRAFRCGDTAAGADGWRIYTPRGYAAKLKQDVAS